VLSTGKFIYHVAATPYKLKHRHFWEALSAIAMMTSLKQTLLEVTNVVDIKMAANQCKS